MCDTFIGASMNRSHSDCVAYRAIFKKENDIGSHHWIKIKNISILRLQEENVIIGYLRSVQKCYHRKKGSQGSNARSNARGQLYSLKLLFWLLAKYSRYISCYNIAPSDGIILNKEAIEKIFKVCEAIDPPLSPAKILLLKLSKRAVFPPMLILILVSVLVLVLHPSLFKVHTEVSDVNHNPDGNPSVTWQDSSYLFSNIVEHREYSRITSVQLVSASAFCLVAMSLFVLVEMVLFLFYSLLHYRYKIASDSVEKELIDEASKL